MKGILWVISCDWPIQEAQTWSLGERCHWLGVAQERDWERQDQLVFLSQPVYWPLPPSVQILQVTRILGLFDDIAQILLDLRNSLKIVWHSLETLDVCEKERNTVISH